MQSSSTHRGVSRGAGIGRDCPASAGAQYVAPPPDPGFRYIFDGTADGLGRVVRQVGVRRRHRGAVAPASEGGQGQATLDTVEGSFLVGASPFGAYWYPVKPFGDAVLPDSVHGPEHAERRRRNGGVMIRSPEIRYTGANTPATSWPQKPTGYNYDVCGGALLICGRDHARGRRRPTTGPALPARSRRRRTPRPAVHLHGRLLRAPRARRTRSTWPEPRPLDAQRQRRQPPALDAGLPAATRSRSTRR